MGVWAYVLILYVQDLLTHVRWLLISNFFLRNIPCVFFIIFFCNMNKWITWSPTYVSTICLKSQKHINCAKKNQKTGWKKINIGETLHDRNVLRVYNPAVFADCNILETWYNGYCMNVYEQCKSRFRWLHWSTAQILFHFWVHILIENFLLNKLITFFLVCELLFTRILTFYVVTNLSLIYWPTCSMCLFLYVAFRFFRSTTNKKTLWNKYFNILWWDMSTAPRKRLFHSALNKEQYYLLNVFRKITQSNLSTVV